MIWTKQRRCLAAHLISVWNAKLQNSKQFLCRLQFTARAQLIWTRTENLQCIGKSDTLRDTCCILNFSHFLKIFTRQRKRHVNGKYGQIQLENFSEKIIKDFPMIHIVIIHDFLNLIPIPELMKCFPMRNSHSQSLGKQAVVNEKAVISFWNSWPTMCLESPDEKRTKVLHLQAS